MHKHEFGTCPECGSLNLNYGDITWNDMNLDPSIQQEITCEDCGCNCMVKPINLTQKKQQNSATAHPL